MWVRRRKAGKNLAASVRVERLNDGVSAETLRLLQALILEVQVGAGNPRTKAVVELQSATVEAYPDHRPAALEPFGRKMTDLFAEKEGSAAHSLGLTVASRFPVGVLLENQVYDPFAAQVKLLTIWQLKVNLADILRKSVDALATFSKVRLQFEKDLILRNVFLQ